MQATIDDFKKIEMRVGRVTAVDDFPKRAIPATSSRSTSVPSGRGGRPPRCGVGTRRSDLLGRLVVCVTNFPPRRIATFDSEVLTLGAVEKDGKVVLLKPDADTELGSLVA